MHLKLFSVNMLKERNKDFGGQVISDTGKLIFFLWDLLMKYLPSCFCMDNTPAYPGVVEEGGNRLSKHYQVRKDPSIIKMRQAWQKAHLNCLRK